MNSNGMKIYPATEAAHPPWESLATDWFGRRLDPPVAYQFVLHPTALQFSARRAAAACSHPDAREGCFQAELWKHDVAEFFLTDPVTGHYLEFNLSPNGAHWCCEFLAPREPCREGRLPEIESRALADPRGWAATALLPRDWLEGHLHFGPRARLNTTFILDSPQQRFLSAVPLPGAEPDFHQPGAFPTLSLVPDASTGLPEAQ